MRTKEFIASLFVGLISLSMIAQQGVYLGEDELPDSETNISPIQDYGDIGNFDGGYHIGDYVADFTVYDLDGNPLNMLSLLEGNKPIVISSSSITCERFTNCFNVFDQNMGNQVARQYMEDNADNFEWVFIYSIEAHPADTADCTSNCPPLPIPAPNGEFIDQHETYQDRMDAAQLWMDIVNNMAYSYDFPHNLWIDNPNNGLYNNFFARPFGCVVLDCDGMVIERGDWTGDWLSEEGGIDFLNSFLQQPWDVCTTPECTNESLDSDGDGICDELEIFEESDPNDPCDPLNVDDDGDGLCNTLEILNGFDPYNACDPDDSDSDGDGFCDVEEAIAGTNPNDPCDPDNTDSDGDGYCDIEENQANWDAEDPCIPDQGEACDLCGDVAFDTDNDGICDEQEIYDGTDPEDPCSPNDFDLDQDGLCDMEETINGTDPEDPCDPDNTDTDNDGYCDILEELNGWDPLDVNDPDNQVGVGESQAGSFILYPNPTKDLIHVSASNTIQRWQLFDMSGRLLISAQPFDKSVVIDMAWFESGTYILLLSTETGLVSRQVVKN